MADLNDLKRYLKYELTLAKNKGFYICPLCGSGGRGTHDSDAALSLTADGEHWRCFSCDPLDGRTGDIFDLFRLRDGLTASQAATAVLQKYGRGTRSTAAEDFTDYQRKKAEKSGKTTPATRQLEDFSDFVARCHAALPGSRGEKYLTGRALTSATLERFNLGYDAAHDAIVLPYPGTPNSYYATRASSKKAYYKPNSERAGYEPLFNGGALYAGAGAVFVVESQLCAISVEQAGGAAVAIGGSGERKLIDAIKGKPTTAALIVCLDNDPHETDDKGRDKHEITEAKARRLAQELTEAGAFALLDNSICGDQKDPNDALQADAGAFAAAVANSVEKAIQARTEAEAGALDSYNAESAAGFIEGFGRFIDDAANTPAIPTGFSGLDKKLEGGLYEGLYILGAISSLGKTTFTLQMIDQIARGGHDCIVFSLEMARYELMAKSISRLTYQQGGAKLAKTTRGILAKQRYDRYSDAEKAAIYEALTTYEAESAPRIWIKEGIGNIGVTEIRADIARHIAITGRRPVVMLDYLQILAPVNDRATDKQNTDKSVLELKRMSRDFKIPVIAISSLNRDNYTAPINLAAFKESGAIEYSADVLIGLQYTGMDYQEGETDKARDKRIREMLKANDAKARDGKGVQIDVKILKNRNGGRGMSDPMTFYPMFNTYVENTGGFMPVDDDGEAVFSKGGMKRV